MAGLDSNVHLGLMDPIMLYLLTQHHNDRIYSREDMGPLHCRHRGSMVMHTWCPHERIMQNLYIPYFYGLYKVCDI